MKSGIWKLESRIWWCAFAIIALGGVMHAEGTLRIVPLVRAEQVIVSIELDNGYTEEVREVINGGVRTTFTYDVDLKMIVPAWVDRTIATAVVTTTDHYDTLTRLHNLSRTRRRPRRRRGGDGERGDREEMADVAERSRAVPHVAAGSASRVLRAHQRARASARRDAPRMGDRRDEPREVYVCALSLQIQHGDTEGTEQHREFFFEKNSP